MIKRENSVEEIKLQEMDLVKLSDKIGGVAEFFVKGDFSTLVKFTYRNGAKREMRFAGSYKALHFCRDLGYTEVIAHHTC